MPRPGENLQKAPQKRRWPWQSPEPVEGEVRLQERIDLAQTVAPDKRPHPEENSSLSEMHPMSPYKQVPTIPKPEERTGRSEGVTSNIKALSLQDSAKAHSRESFESRLPSTNKRPAAEDDLSGERASKSRPGGGTDSPMQSPEYEAPPAPVPPVPGSNQIPSPSSQPSSPRQTTPPLHQPMIDKIIFPPPLRDADDVEEGDTSLLRQPETRAITQDQLVNEVKGIYAGLVMVEKKCVEIDQQQSQTTNKLSTEQWQALIALHRTLLHEHHDFFLASQHPSASPALRRLASKYAMPARMWRHGIHSFLELLRHRLPDSLDHMLAFVYLAYSMMALLMESVPSFLETWIECLGDLARYRMAIEEADLRDREIWSGVARMWYNKAADRSPNVGRIQHHLAVLARPNIVQQLYYYSKALVSVIPFVNARESVMLLFTPFLENTEMASQKHALLEIEFIQASGTLFTKGSIKRYIDLMERVIASLDNHIARTSAKFRIQGPEIVSSLIAASLGFGETESPLLRCLTEETERLKNVKDSNLHPGDIPMETPMDSPKATLEHSRLQPDPTPDSHRRHMLIEYWASSNRVVPGNISNAIFSTQDSSTKDATFSGSHDSSAIACQVLGSMTNVVCQRTGDKNVLPYMHIYLAFLFSLAHVPGALEYVEGHVPWDNLASFLNTLKRPPGINPPFEGPEFPQSVSGTGRQLPEDFLIRGLVWSPYCLPEGFFEGQVVDEDERTLELPSHAEPRIDRCLHIGVELALCGRWLNYNYDSKEFRVTQFGREISQMTAAYTLS